MTLSIDYGNPRKDKSVKVYIRVEHKAHRVKVDSHVVLNKLEYSKSKKGYKIRNMLENP